MHYLIKLYQQALQKVLHVIFLIVSFLARKCFQRKNGLKGARVSPIINPILLFSATELAAKIREKEVCKLDFQLFVFVTFLYILVD